MLLEVQPSKLQGQVAIPGSKSHTIRALLIASLAEGESRLQAPLYSADAEAALGACRALGATVEVGDEWVVRGVGGQVQTPAEVIDVGNSGTTLYLAAAVAALGSGLTVLSGDDQIRRRPVGPLLAALHDLGAHAVSTRGNGLAPLIVGGPLVGGQTALACPTSQYLTALLLACPLARGESIIEVTELNERPYVEMTLDWLQRQGIHCERQGLEYFRIPGGQQYQAFERVIPADFSSATFFLCAAALEGNEVLLTGLDMTDSQGDKAVVEMLRAMGAQIREERQGLLVQGGELKGAELDLNATPDALPALAVTACLAQGESRLVNVPQARLKETDRIAVMARELGKLGARLTERPDGLVIQGGRLQGGEVEGWGDHRVVMALALAGLRAAATVTISTAEAMAVTFPNYVALMQGLGARMNVV